MSERDQHEAWEGAIGSEVAFWRQWIATGGDKWPHEFEARLDPETPLEGAFAAAVSALEGEHVRMLDVGAGPLTSLGKRLPGKQLEVLACDPLAPQYDELLEEFGVVPPVRTLACDGERLLDRFAPESFDVTHSRNALDHSYDPYAAVVAMLTLVRPGGLVVLSHFRNEAVGGYGGLHQWNFDIGTDGAFLIWHPRGVVDVTARLRDIADVRVLTAPGAAAVDVVITRHAGTEGLTPEAIAERAAVDSGFDRPLVEFIVIDPGTDPAAEEAFRASVAAHAEEADSIKLTFMPREAALPRLVADLPRRAQYLAFLGVEDVLRTRFPVREGAVSELAMDTAIASRALAGGTPADGLRGRLVRASSAPALLDRTAWDAPRSAAPAGDTRVICVLGFHRSGTSMTARLLNLLGVDLGPETELVPALEGDNPRGYWEPAWMVSLNDELLRAFGGSDLDAPAFPVGWQRSPEFDGLRARARDLLDEKLDGVAVWGFKDPRTCLTLPFWQDLLAERAIDVRYVVCLRSPADTAASMISRGYQPPLSAARWGALWLEYTARALAATAGEPRLLVAYDDLLANGLVEAARIADFAGLPLPTGVRRVELEAAIEPGLRHHASTLLSTAAERTLPVAARSAFLALRAAARLRRSGDATELPAALEQIAVEHGSVAAPLAGRELHDALMDAVGALQRSDLVSLTA